MRKALVLIFSCALGVMVACGGGNGASNAGGNTVVPPTSSNNVAAVVVDAGPTVGGSQIGYTNGLFVTINVCVPGTTQCQSIDHVLVDTGSMGLRLLGSVLTLPLPQQMDSAGNGIAECNQFLDGFTWGPIQSADIAIAGEKAPSAPIQVISENAPFTVPSGCTGTNEDTIQSLAANGILGIGPFLQDCGPTCVTSTSPGLYYTCSSTGCSPTTQPLNAQVQNPVSMFTGDNNGSIIELPGISSNGATAVQGSLVFGIGTQSNNQLQNSMHVLFTDGFGDITTVYNNVQYSGSFIDSGSNGIFFLDSGTLGIPTCPSPDTSFYCPGAPNNNALNLRNLTAINMDSAGNQSQVNFSIANAEFLFSQNASGNFAFNNLGGPNVVPASSGSTTTTAFDWGLPFFFGRNVVTAIENQNTPAGAGPFFAY